MVNELIEKLDKQQGFYIQMLALAQKQVRMLEQAGEEVEVEPLLGLLAQRQHLMEQIEGLEATALRLQREIAGELGLKDFHLRALANRIPQPEYERLALVLGGLSRTVQTIGRCDESGQEILQSRLAGLKQKLQHLQAGKKTAQAYQAYGAGTDSRFIDYKK